MPENQAAYIHGAKLRPLVVNAAPYTPPGPDQIVVKNAAIAINTLDDAKQTLGNIMFGWIKYPFVMGSDVAGRVVEVGSNVTRFKVGDRVIGLAFGMDQKYNTSTMSGFQHYTVVIARMASPIPESLAFVKAAVLPLALSTAASALFQKDQLGLRLPTGPAREMSNKTREVLLVWGGSSSVGCNAIQLATAAGYEVITTCSPRNFDLVRRLGATTTFDYTSNTTIDNIVGFCRGKSVAGALSMGNGDSALRCADLLGKCEGNRFISIATFPAPKNKDAGLPTMLWTMASWQASMAMKCYANGIKWKFVWGSSLEGNEVGKVIWEDYLPQALANGKHITAPEAYVVGHGLEHVQEGIDLVHKGVSATKCVVTLG
ncbi:oxidoreductase [Coniochaeta sp. PMI_546]|nr:oxidoreductase [Coniochaeta sp. PMI_546]